MPRTDNNTSKLQLTSGNGCFCGWLSEIGCDSYSTQSEHQTWLGMTESAAGTDYQELSHRGRLHPQDTQERRWNADTQWQLFLGTIFSLNGHCSARFVIFVLSRLWNLPRPHLGALYIQQSHAKSCLQSTKTVLNNPLQRVNKLKIHWQPMLNFSLKC